LVGIGVFSMAAKRGHEAPAGLWLIAGLAIAGGHALHVADDRHALAGLIKEDGSVWIRARLAVTEGWSEGRWGWRTRVRVLDSDHKAKRIPDLRRCRLEVRGSVQPMDLPRPGSIVDGLVSIRGSPRSPLLVASSPRLIEPTSLIRPLPTIRGRFADDLLTAAGTDVDRIRAAELAAALSLGRRDLLPKSSQDGWRRSGLAHVLAVSGLHVGLVAGMTWFLLAAGGVSPTTARIVTLVVLPTYAILAGASPSAVRAALMGVIYLSARLMGRAIVPMAAVLLAALLLLIADPSLIAEVSFQFTVVLTAALVRWAPRLSAAIPLPRWLSVAVAVPIIAQLAAAPLVVYHFSTAIPGAVASNLLVPWLLAPVVLASVTATAIAPLWIAAAGRLLDLVGLGVPLLWFSGMPGRAAELIPPPLPIPLLIAMVVFGVLSLVPGRPAGVGVILYLIAVTAFGVWWLVIPPPERTEIELLPVSHGLALRISSGDTHVLMDGGAAKRESAELLAPTRSHRFAAVIASHGDEDHIGGLDAVLRTSTVDRLILPAWLMRSSDAVPLLRTARRRDVRVVPVVRGSRVDFGPFSLDVLWPPASNLPTSENERSIVARLHLDVGTVLLTADIGRTTERRLTETTSLGSTILIVPHHGSRHSASSVFLDATSPRLALVSAGPKNLHHHPHPEVLERLDARGIAYRMPIRDGRCGARWEDGDWVLYPEEVKGEE